MHASKKLWQPNNLADMFFTNGEKYANKNVLNYKSGHKYEKLSYGELKDEIIKAVLILKKLKIKTGDRVLLVSENRPEWVIVDVALMSIGAISVPIHKNLSTEQVKCIVNETKPVLAFVSDEIALKTVSSGKNELMLKRNISFDSAIPKQQEIVSFDKLMSAIVIKDETKIVAEARSISKKQIMTIVYTSGTTGKPKGAQLTHENFIFVAQRAVELLKFNDKDIFLSILPLSHIFERLAGNFLPIYARSSIAYCTDVANFSSDLKTVRPTIILAVPRLFEKIYNQVQETVGGSVLKKLIFKLGMNHQNPNDFVGRLFQKLIFSKVHQKLGGKIRICIAGGAALNPDIITFFNRLNVALVEGYGLTETASAISVNDINSNKISTVGRPFPGLKLKIAEDGEILVKGPSVTSGYLNPLDTVDAFTDDGYFKTGDIGIQDEDGYLSITGRKKDIQVLSTGEKVVPSIVENALTSSPFIEQALLIGDGYKHIAAIVTLNQEAIEKELAAEATNNMKVDSFITNEIVQRTKSLPPIQQIRKFIIASETFSVENNQMTASMKLRRQAIEKKYAAEIRKLYGY